MMELQSLGQYRIEAEIDSNWAAAQLRVRRCRAVDTVRKRPVLLSLFERQPDCGLDDSGLLRLLNQTLPASDLVHPRLAWVWEAGEIDGHYYLAERAVQGQTLAQRLAERGPLGWAEAQTAIDQIAQGLDYAHTHGWTHGALSPAMMWLSTDLGAIISGGGMQHGRQTLRLEHPAGEAHRVLVPYLAPERLAGAAPSPAADQYALACLWFEMLTGQPLFAPAGPDMPEATEQAHRQAGPMFPAAWPQGTPWEIEPALERGAAAAPPSRFPTAGDLAAAPARLATEMPGSAEERARRAALARQRQEAAEQARRQAEEARRLSALNQARKEIEEQVQRAAQASLRLNDETGETNTGADQAVEAGKIAVQPTGEPPVDQVVDSSTQPAEATVRPASPGAGTPETASAGALPVSEATPAAPAAAVMPAPAGTPTAAGILEAGSPGHRGVTRKAGPGGGSSLKAPAGNPPLMESSPATAAPAPPVPVMDSEKAAAADTLLPASAVASSSTAAQATAAEAPQAGISRPSAASERAPRWILWAGLAVAALLFGWLWWSNQAGGGVLGTPTPGTPAASATRPGETRAVQPAGQVSPGPLATTAAPPTRPAATPTPTAAQATTAAKTSTATKAATATPTLSKTPAASVTSTPAIASAIAPAETDAPTATATRRIFPTSTRAPNGNRQDRDDNRP